MHVEFTQTDIQGFDQRYRANFINSLGGFKSIALVGTRSRKGLTNLAVFNSFFHLGANPPLFGFIIRPDSVERHTLENILETGEFTVNHIHEDIYMQAHQTAARYTRDESEFAATGLTEFYKPGLYVPFVQESRIRIAASFKQKVSIEQNGTIMVIAGIKNVYLPAACLGSDGFIDLTAAGSLAGSGLDAYHKTAPLQRLSYPKPGQTLQALAS